MNMEEILKKLNQAIQMIETVDLNSSNTYVKSVSQRRVHKTYDILLDMRKDIERMG